MANDDYFSPEREASINDAAQIPTVLILCCRNKKGTAPHEENSPCNTTEQQHRGYATSMRFVSFSAF